MNMSVTSLKTVADSLNEMEAATKAAFNQCYETIRDIMQYSSDRYGDLMKIKKCMEMFADTQKEIVALFHATDEISSLADRSSLSKEEAIKKFEEILNENMTEENIDDNQFQILSSLNTFLSESQETDDEHTDGELLVTKTTHSYKDPLTKCNIEDPVKSKTCNHAYERSSILQYLSSSRKKCPYSGCQTELRREDLMDHFVLKMKLLSDKMEESVPE